MVEEPVKYLRKSAPTRGSKTTSSMNSSRFETSAPWSLRRLDQQVLNISNKIRSNLFAWRGQFSPQLIETLLLEYAPSHAFVLDPFVGSGTVLYEAGRLALSAFGTEINPAAAKMANVYYFINRTQTQRESLIRYIDRLLEESVPIHFPLLGRNNHVPTESCERLLTALLSKCQIADALIAMEALVVTLDYFSQAPTSSRIFSKWNALKKIISTLPYSTEPIGVAICDARTLPIDANSVDFVVTSPPYINVFNYHQQYRASMESLGWNLLRVAKSEIGSNRKHRQNRFLTVIQYCLDMFDVLMELKRVCKDRCQLIFVVGRESNVKKTQFFNGQIVERLATGSAGFKICLRQQRVFENKYGKRIYEDILHFQNLKDFRPSNNETPQAIAKFILEDAVSRAPMESQEDLHAALSMVEKVKPSPIFRSLSA